MFQSAQRLPFRQSSNPVRKAGQRKVFPPPPPPRKRRSPTARFPRKFRLPPVISARPETTEYDGADRLVCAVFDGYRTVGLQNAEPPRGGSGGERAAGCASRPAGTPPGRSGRREGESPESSAVLRTAPAVRKPGGPVTVWCAPPRENNRENPLCKKRGRPPECRILQVVQRIIHFCRWIFGKMFAVLYGHLQKGWYNNSKHFIRRAAERNPDLWRKRILTGAILDLAM